MAHTIVRYLQAIYGVSEEEEYEDEIVQSMAA